MERRRSDSSSSRSTAWKKPKPGTIRPTSRKSTRSATKQRRRVHSLSKAWRSRYSLPDQKEPGLAWPDRAAFHGRELTRPPRRRSKSIIHPETNNIVLQADDVGVRRRRPAVGAEQRQHRRR